MSAYIHQLINFPLVCVQMVLSAQGHQIFNYVLSLAPSVDMVNIYRFSSADFAKYYIGFSVAEMLKVNFGVFLHYSSDITVHRIIKNSITA